ncbi:MAG: hypothetical protein N839_0004240 [Desulfofustis sp. PB-SRB1]|nr:hypothetical protein [Desulfofustis sp. PB-SRB1]HBH27931.1 hypothetical protein [Desulfofustis sp.]HBH32114.1 hypothetical protein [Desulfofustis sp.]
MDRKTISFIREALPKGRTIYYDCPDRYAFLLLALALDEKGCHVGTVRRSNFAPLLNKPRVKTFLAATGDGWLRPTLHQRQRQSGAAPHLHQPRHEMVYPRLQ